MRNRLGVNYSEANGDSWRGLGGDNKKKAVGTDASGSVDNDFISHSSA